MLFEQLHDRQLDDGLNKNSMLRAAMQPQEGQPMSAIADLALPGRIRGGELNQL